MSVEVRLAVLCTGVLLLAAGCGSHARVASPPPPPTAHERPAPPPRRCAAGSVRRLGSVRRSFLAFAPRGAVAYRAPGRRAVARFGAKNLNGYPTLFGVLAARVGTDCRARWYRVELPIRPNGATGWVAASSLRLRSVGERIVVDVARRRLMLYRSGRRVLTAVVAVGSPATPTPLGRYYVNQRLIPDDPGGPFGPAAIGISAFSPVLTGWAQGGPVAIHGTNEPWSIGHAVSNGCIRLPNATLSRVFATAVAGTPVIIRA